MEYQEDDERELLEEKRGISNLGAKTKASVGLLGMLATGAFDGFGHLGLAGAVIGAVVTGILVVESPRIARKLQQDFPELYARLQAWGNRAQEPQEYTEEELAELAAFERDWEEVQRKMSQDGEELEDGEDDGSVVLNLSRTWSPAADSFLSQRIAVIGQPGSGKSNTVTDVVEEIGALEVPLLLLDTEAEYAGLCDPQYLPSGVVWSAEDVTLANARELGQSILAERLQVILDLHSFDDDDEAALVICGLIDGINEWEEAQPIRSRVSCMVILDEAAVWLPQAVNESILSKKVLTQLQQTFFRTVVRRGRKRGIGFLLATQRVAEIDKRALSATWVILHRQTLPNDLKVYKEYGIEAEDARSLRPGQAYVLGPNDFSEIVQFRKRHSEDNAFTPGLASVRAPRPAARPGGKGLNEQNQARRREREQRLSGRQPVRLEERTAIKPAPQPEEPEEKIEAADLARAYVLWQAGHASVRRLYEAAKDAGYGWSNGYCRDVIKAMRKERLIPQLEEVM